MKQLLAGSGCPFSVRLSNVGPAAALAWAALASTEFPLSGPRYRVL